MKKYDRKMACVTITKIVYQQTDLNPFFIRLAFCDNFRRFVRFQLDHFDKQALKLDFRRCRVLSWINRPDRKLKWNKTQDIILTSYDSLVVACFKLSSRTQFALYLVNVSVNVNCRKPTKMGCCNWLPYFVYVYWDDFSSGTQV